MLALARAAMLSSIAFVKQSYAQTVGSLGPVAYWALGDAIGSSIIDDDRNVQDGAYQGTIEFGVEPIVRESSGTSIGFNGVNAYGEIPHNSEFALTDGTIALAMQADNVSGQRILVAKDGGLPLGGFTVDINNGRLRAYLRNAAGPGTAQWLPDEDGAADIGIDVAHHVALTWGSRGAELWLDGTLVASKAGLTVGLGSNTADLFLAAYPGPTAFADVVLDEVALFNRQLTSEQVRSLAKPRSIAHAHSDAPGVGIQIPPFEFQTIRDTHPVSNFCWWDPTGGSDLADGLSKANAKQTFSAAELAISPGGTVIVAGGTHTLNAAVAPTKPMTIRAEQNAEVVFYRDARFKGAWEGTWTWTEIDAAKHIWESPVINHGLSANTDLDGFIVIPNGGVGKHFMRLPWANNQSDFESTSTGGVIGTNGTANYCVPWLWVPNSSRIRIRMQQIPAAYGDADWPTDGRMGTLISGTGSWQEPVSQNPNDYQIFIVQWSAKGGSSVLFDIDGISSVTIKGINGALCGRAFDLQTAQNVTIEKGTYYVDEQFCRHRGNTTNFTARRVRAAMGDQRHINWSDYKISGGYYNPALRGEMLGVGSSGTVASSTHKNARFEHCTFYGFFDLVLPASVSDGPIVLDHCAIIRNVDDGLQERATSALAIEIGYCYWRGGPMGGWEQVVQGTAIDHTHHTVYHLDTPMHISGRTRPHRRMPEHTTGSTGPVRPLRTYYCTFIQSPDTENTHPMNIGHYGRNLTAGAREIYNNILMIRDNKRYSGPGGDPVSTRICCQQSTAGTFRTDHNLYHKEVPSPSSTLLFEWQNSHDSGRASFPSLATFRLSALKSTSVGMYSDGTDGHEHHGVEEDPQFVDLAARDYRPQSSGAISGAKNLSTLGWPGTGTFENWKGALNPNGDGREVGPQEP